MRHIGDELARRAAAALMVVVVGCGGSSGGAGRDAAPDAVLDGPADPCAPNPCVEPNRTQCIPAGGAATCGCDPFTILIDGACVPVCAPAACSGHGDCAVTGTTLSCTCQPGYAGGRCETCDATGGYHADGHGGCTTDPCTPDPCAGQPDRVCDATGTCLCRAGTHEDGGACVPDDTCRATTCAGHGACSAAGGHVTCACDPGWAPPNCQACDAAGGYHADGAGGCTTDPCTPNPCTELHRVVCTADQGAARCGCDAGYHDAGGACVVDETCTSSSCHGHGACAVVGGVAGCACDAGYTGPTCDACAGGFHADGQGGCTDDPCTPNPCVAPLHTVCVADGLTATCRCDVTAHPDGQGGCTTDPCTPNPCAASNQACRTGAAGGPECYAPDCDDGDPCTADARVAGVCQHTQRADGTSCVTSACVVGQTCQGGACGGGGPTDCDDHDPCTRDGCDPGAGCTNEVDATLVPDDGVACTVDSCDAGGAAHHVASDAACDDGLYCTGVERCQPAAGGADARGCVHTSVPQPPAAAACITYGACREGLPHFLSQAAAPGTPCDDHLACTTGDQCQAGGACVGTPIASCLGGACAATTAYAGSVDVPVATLATVGVTVAGQPLPAGPASDSTTMTLYLRATDTGALHEVRDLWYTSGGGPWPAGGDHAHSVLPGLYDVVYRRGYTPSSGIVAEDAPGDPLPYGYRVLREGLLVGAGQNDLTVDVPVATLAAVNVTVAGAALPSGPSASSSTMTLYLKARDTGALHQVRHLWYTSGGGPWPAGGDHAYSLVPGVYDVVYERAYARADNTVAENPTGDVLPNGYRVLSRGLTLSPGANSVSIDVPVATLGAVNVTLGGSPLPSGGNPSSTTLTIYLRAKDTGALHEIRDLWYTSSGGPWPAGGDHAYSLVPGDYEVVYRRGYAASDGTVAGNPTGDRLPNGYRLLGDVTLAPGANSLAVDIPVATLASVAVTLDGAALPSGPNSDSSTMTFYLRARDTGALHEIRSLWYTSGGGPWPAGGDHAYSLLPGAYDVVYRRAYSSATREVSENGATDLLPNGFRVLGAVTLAAGANSVSIDVPVATLRTVGVTLDGASLPASGNSDSTRMVFYLRAQDTGALHEIRTIWYTSSGGPWPAGGAHAHSLLPGTYDLVFSRAYTPWTGTVTGTVRANTATDFLPDGYRVLREGIALAPGPNDVAIDLRQTALAADVTLAGAPLPATGDSDSNSMTLYLRARDTGALHELRTLWYTSYGGPWPASGDHARSVPPGAYDVVYRRAYSPADGTVAANAAPDFLPNGFRVLQRCVAP
ncbi:MAG TPA: hypothetical protein VGQ83_31490 [Polyangia bacterium]|jgi:hypothetical protein